MYSKKTCDEGTAVIQKMWISNRNGAVALNSTTAPFSCTFWEGVF